MTYNYAYIWHKQVVELQPLPEEHEVRTGVFPFDPGMGLDVEDRYIVDGWWVSKAMMDIAVAIRTLPGYRKVRFGVGAGEVSAMGLGNRKLTHARELHIYYPDQVYTMGSIRIRDDEYRITSRRIWKAQSERARYNDSKYRCTAKAKTIRSALTAVKRNLVPYTDEETTITLLQDSYNPYQEYSRAKYQGNTLAARQEIVRRITEHNSELNKELRSWLNSSYVFTYPEARSVLEQFVCAQGEENEVMNTTFIASLVYVEEGAIRVRSVVGTVPIRDVDSGTFVKQFVSDAARVSTYKEVSELPEAMMERIATLHIVPVSEFVENVGMRISDSAYLLVGV
jgi:hypothetical protein